MAWNPEQDRRGRTKGSQPPLEQGPAAVIVPRSTPRHSATLKERKEVVLSFNEESARRILPKALLEAEDEQAPVSDPLLPVVTGCDQRPCGNVTSSSPHVHVLLSCHPTNC